MKSSGKITLGNDVYTYMHFGSTVASKPQVGIGKCWYLTKILRVIVPLRLRLSGAISIQCARCFTK